MTCLEEEGLNDNTIVVFTADHGEMMGSHGAMNKCLWYDECFLVPFIIRWPGRIKSGRDDLHLAAPDVMPSLLGLMELSRQIPKDVEGSNHSAVMLGENAGRPESALYLESIQRSRSGSEEANVVYALIAIRSLLSGRRARKKVIPSMIISRTPIRSET